MFNEYGQYVPQWANLGRKREVLVCKIHVAFWSAEWSLACVGDKLESGKAWCGKVATHKAKAYHFGNEQYEWFDTCPEHSDLWLRYRDHLGRIAVSDGVQKLEDQSRWEAFKLVNLSSDTDSVEAVTV